jgi:hypothetical protein
MTPFGVQRALLPKAATIILHTQSVFQLDSGPDDDILQNRVQYVPHVNDRIIMENMVNLQASGLPEG